MDFENIIPVIFLVIYAIFVFFRKKKGNKKKKKKTSSSINWVEKINALIAQVQAVKKPVPDIIEPPGDVRKEKQLEDGEIEVIWEKNEKPKPFRKSLIPEMPERVKRVPEPPALNAQTAKKPGSEKSFKGIIGPSDFSVTNLKKAIVWSEILRPPIALRDD